MCRVSLLFGSSVIEWIRKKVLQRSNYGRDYGWYIFHEEKVIGELVDCRTEEMFWDSYRVIHYGEVELIILKTSQHWEEAAFTFKNRKISAFAGHAFGNYEGYTSGKTDRILMRGLYLLPADRQI